MGQFVVATGFAWISIALAWLILPRGLRGGMDIRVVATWGLAAGLLFLINEPMLTLVGFGAALLAAASSKPAERVALFLATVGCLPSMLSVELAFPGINQLTTLTPYRVAVLVLLLPILVQAWSSKDPYNRSSIAIGCLVAYSFLSCILTAALPSATSTSITRLLIDQLLILVVPFLAIVLAIRNLEDFDTCLKGFLLGSVLLASVGVVAGLKHWDFYLLTMPASLFTIPDTRAGFVRINATANTHSLGMHLAAALLVLQYLKDRLRIDWVQVNLLRALFLAGIYFTHSRGAMAALGLAIFVYAIMRIESRQLRTSMFALACVGVVAVGFWLANAEFTSGDISTGSFYYRQELLATSIKYIQRYPLFGDVAYQTRLEFVHLVNGQGIIDITNLYLQIALPFGLVGLALMFAPIVLPMSGLVRRHLWPLKESADPPSIQSSLAVHRFVSYPVQHSRVSVATVPLLLASVLMLPLFYAATFVIERARQASRRPLKSDDSVSVTQRWANSAGLMICIICGWLFLVTTTSDVALTVHIGLVTAAMGQALCDLTRSDNAVIDAGKVAQPGQAA